MRAAGVRRLADARAQGPERPQAARRHARSKPTHLFWSLQRALFTLFSRHGAIARENPIVAARGRLRAARGPGQGQNGEGDTRLCCLLFVVCVNLAGQALAGVLMKRAEGTLISSIGLASSLPPRVALDANAGRWYQQLNNCITHGCRVPCACVLGSRCMLISLSIGTTHTGAPIKDMFQGGNRSYILGIIATASPL